MVLIDQLVYHLTLPYSMLPKSPPPLQWLFSWLLLEYGCVMSMLMWYWVFCIDCGVMMTHGVIMAQWWYDNEVTGMIGIIRKILSFGPVFVPLFPHYHSIVIPSPITLLSPLNLHSIIYHHHTCGTSIHNEKVLAFAYHKNSQIEQLNDGLSLSGLDL